MVSRRCRACRKPRKKTHRYCPHCGTDSRDVSPLGPGDQVQNIEEPILPMTEFDVCPWYPLPDCQGKPEQVHIVFRVAPDLPQMSIRLKSRRACDEVIDALEKWRTACWGPRV